MVSLRPLFFLVLTCLSSYLIAFACANTCSRGPPKIVTNEESVAFLAAKKKEPGVVSLPSGVMYKEILGGQGKSPSARSSIKAHISWELFDGTVVHPSSFDRDPFTLQVNELVEGAQEGIQLMKEGGLWELYVPPLLGFGEEEWDGGIPGGSAMVFKIELLEVGEAPPHQPTKKEGEDFLARKATEEGVVSLPSGLLYKELTTGHGKKPTIDSPCSCHYSGSLIDGTEFDSSNGSDDPSTFSPSEVISGLSEAMQLMNEGSKWELYVPPDLGYGDNAVGDEIPGGSTLVYTLEILKVFSNFERPVEL